MRNAQISNTKAEGLITLAAMQAAADRVKKRAEAHFVQNNGGFSTSPRIISLADDNRVSVAKGEFVFV
ncbi:MAG: hypothetical protein L0154_14100 [Chloroflexi bacterium]|nr:hypothetical protein [Chloroflexota bacterium]